MKLATYLYNKRLSCGIITEKGIIDIPSSAPANPPHSIKDMLMKGNSCLTEIADLIKIATDFIHLENIQLLAPIPDPGKLIALAGNYTKHIIEGGMKLGLSESPHDTTVPRPFIMPNTAVTGDRTEIPWPTYSEQVDYELELAVVIGKEAKCISPDEALDYVAGYTIANDISARSVTFSQNRIKRPWDEFFDWLNGKWSDSFLPMGPYLVTADEISQPQNLDMELTVNDEIRQKANTSDMIFSVAEIVSFLSFLMTLEPGDCIATGTPEGVGMATGNFLKSGDCIKCTIDKIGTLTNTIGKRPKKFYKPLVK